MYKMWGEEKKVGSHQNYILLFRFTKTTVIKDYKFIQPIDQRGGFWPFKKKEDNIGWCVE